MTRCEYQFRPVGQGCFFTGIFKKNSKQVLKFVYDCGTDTGGSYLNNAISIFKSEISTAGKKPIIDLLTISHFDDDHVIGVLELLKGVKCKYLVMPFLSIHERLALFSKGGPKAEWHKAFLRNPQAFISLNDYDIENVIFIDSGNQNLDGDFPNSLQIDPEPPSETKHITSTTPFLDDEIKLDDKFQYVKMPFELKAGKIDFKFKFYVKAYPEATITKFHDEVKAEFPARKVADLFNDYDRLLLKGLYKKIFKDRNKTSLCVAIIKNSFKGVFYHDNPNMQFPYTDRESTILLTGDSSLKSKKEIAAFTDYYAPDLDDVVLYQVPHHGSKYNSRLDIHSRLWNFPMFVINHGSKSKSHPHPDLKTFVATNIKNLWHNTELIPVTLTYEVDIW